MAKLGFGATFKLHNGTALTSVGEIIDIKVPHLQGSTVETTHHASAGAFKEYIAGLIDSSDLEVKINLNAGDASHALLTAQVAARTARAFEIVIPGTGATVWKFTGLCIPLTVEIDTPLDDRQTATFTAKVTGPITEAVGP